MPYQLKSANKRALKLEKITFQMCPSLIRLQIPLETWAVRILLSITFFISSSYFPSKQNFTKRELKTAFGFNIFFEKNLSLESPGRWKSGLWFLVFPQGNAIIAFGRLVLGEPGCACFHVLGTELSSRKSNLDFEKLLVKNQNQIHSNSPVKLSLEFSHPKSMDILLYLNPTTTWIFP